jgi:hypothetical protein
MRRSRVTVAVTAVGLLMTGCGTNSDAGAPVDNTAKVCGEFHSVVDRYSFGDAPERLAYVATMQAAYTGDGEQSAASAAKVAYFQAWARDLRPVAARANDPELKTALHRAADGLEAIAGGQASAVAELDTTWRPVLDSCPQPSPTA